MTASTRRNYRPTVSLEEFITLEQIVDKNGNAVDFAIIDPNLADGGEGSGTINDPFTSWPTTPKIGRRSGRCMT